MNHGKSKKSFSKIKSNHFSKNLGKEMRKSSSSYNLRKQSNRKRRNATTGSKSKILNKSYYSNREKEVSKRRANPSQIATEISESNFRKSNPRTTGSKRHCESTNLSDKKHLLNSNTNIPEDEEVQTQKRDLLLKHSSLINNGSRTVRNHHNEVLNKSCSNSEKGTFAK